MHPSSEQDEERRRRLGGRSRDLAREIPEPYRRAGGERHGPLDDVLELPHVAGKRVGLERAEGVRCEAADVLVLLAGAARQEVLREGADVFAAIAEGGNLDANDVEAVVEVLTEGPGADLLLDVPVGRRQDAHVDGDLVARPDAAHLAFLEDAKQLHLERRGQLTDLVEEDRPALRVAGKCRRDS